MALDKKILSIDADDEDIDIKSFTKFSEETTKRDKNFVANQFIELGEDLLAEVEEKKQRKEIRKDKLIRYIIKHDKDKIYGEKRLKSYSFEDVLNIHNEFKTRGTFLQRLFRFIFNL
jgi:hypothetical protein